MVDNRRADYALDADSVITLKEGGVPKRVIAEMIRRARATSRGAIRDTAPELDEKAIEAVQKWRFKPGKHNGVPMKVRALVDVNFRM